VSLLPVDDPCRGTLVLLPLLVAGFWAIERWAVGAGRRRLGRLGSGVEVGALVLWIGLAFARFGLGLPRMEEALFAGFLLLLGHRVARQLVAARPLLGKVLPSRPAPVFFALPLLVYVALLPWSSLHRPPDGDEPFYLLLTHSLVHDLDAELTNNYVQGDWRSFLDRPLSPQPGDPVGPHGEKYSRHNELLPLLLAPAYLLGGKAGALVTMALLSAALAWMTLRLARHYFPQRPGEALVAYGLMAFTPPLLLYSGQIWVEVPAALLTAIALDCLLTLRGPAGIPSDQIRWEPRHWLGIGLPLILLPLLKIRLMLLALPLLGLAALHAGRSKGSRRQVLLLAALLAGVGGGILLHNSLLYANPLKIHSWQEVDLHHYRIADFALGFSGLFWDVAFGLFLCAPLWLLLLPALLLLAGRHRLLLLHLGALITPYLLIVAPRGEWYGGWSPPFRYPLVILPLLAIALIPLLADLRRHRRPGARFLVAALGWSTLALTLAWVAVPGWTYNFADGRTYLLDHLSQRIGADVARFFPSSVRPRAATWLWPLLTSLLLPVIWWWRGGRRRRGGAPELWGVTALLLGAAALVAASTHLPTRIIELEDAQVAKSGGHPHPDRWVIERTRYRGGWVLRVGEQLTAPLQSGGKRLELRLQAQFIRNQPTPFTLEIRAGDQLLGLWTPNRERHWETLTFGPVAWPAEAPLVLRARGPQPPGALNGAILDRAELHWR
jgi:hypothetical protein